MLLSLQEAKRGGQKRQKIQKRPATKFKVRQIHKRPATKVRKELKQKSRRVEKRDCSFLAPAPLSQWHDTVFPPFAAIHDGTVSQFHLNLPKVKPLDLNVVRASYVAVMLHSCHEGKLRNCITIKSSSCKNSTIASYVG